MAGGKRRAYLVRDRLPHMALSKLQRGAQWGMAAVAMLLGQGCPSDDTGGSNVLPTASATGNDTGMTSSESVDTTAGGGAISFPSTYRFDCIDIVEIGDGNGDGQPDGESIQGVFLENTWAADIAAFKLNIMLSVRERDDAGGPAVIVIGSGVGPNAMDLCSEPTTVSGDLQAVYDPAGAVWQPSPSTDACAEAAADDVQFGGTYSFDLPSDDTVYIYAEDDDGTVFNCVPGGGSPDAVPLHAIRAVVTMNEDETVASGQLTGCLVDSEAQALCSCLGECSGPVNPECAGCPDGSTPLAVLLGKVGPTDACTEIMGETAYDLTVGFTTRLLDVDEPMACGA